MTTLSIHELPVELQTHILSFLETPHLLHAKQTCKYWQVLIKENIFYRDRSLSRWPALKILDTAEKTDSHWRKIYSEECQLESRWKNRSRSTMELKAKFTETQNADELEAGKMTDIFPFRSFLCLKTKNSLMYSYANQPFAMWLSTNEIIDCAIKNQIESDHSETIVSLSIYKANGRHIMERYEDINICTEGKSSSSYPCESDVPGIQFVFHKKDDKRYPFLLLTKNGYLLDATDYTFFFWSGRNFCGSNKRHIYTLDNRSEVLKACMAENLLACYHADGQLNLYAFGGGLSKQTTGVNFAAESLGQLVQLVTDGIFLLAGFEETIKIFKINDLSLINTVTLPAKLTCLASDGKKWAAGTVKKTVEFFNCATGDHLHTLALEEIPTAVAFDKYDQDAFFAGLEDGRLVKYTLNY